MMFPGTIREINLLPEPEKRAIYSTLLPSWLFTDYSIDPETYMVNEREAIRFRYPEQSRSFELTVKRFAHDIDPILYFHMADSFSNQIMVLLVVVNDPDAPRFNIDIDQEGNPTHFGTVGRNIPAELAALEAGLSPGQVRQGLRNFRTLVPNFERFIMNMNRDMFLIEPLAYHNAIIFERYGFNYVKGFHEMQRIHEQFQPNNELYNRLSEDNPFRQPNYASHIRGRSWAIHDGILGHPFTGFQMYKQVGRHMGINTFPDSQW